MDALAVTQLYTYPSWLEALLTCVLGVGLSKGFGRMHSPRAGMKDPGISFRAIDTGWGSTVWEWA